MILRRLQVLSAPAAVKLGWSQRGLEGLEAEVVHPGETLVTPPTFFDPADWGRVTAPAWQSNMDLERRRVAAGPRQHGPTLRYRLRNVLATPSGLFSPTRSVYRNGDLPVGMVMRSPVRRHERGFAACMDLTGKYFGHWLHDGLPATLLSREDEALYFPDVPGAAHAPGYRSLVGHGALPDSVAFFRELSFADDRGMNSHRMARIAEVQRRVQQRLRPSGHPGVFIRRGTTGVARILLNEDEVAAALGALGYAVVHASDPLQRILGAAAGVPVVVSLEGSHSIHGLFAARRGALIVMINPADQFNNLLADLLPGFGQRLGSIVAERDGAGYRIDVTRLIALISRAQKAMTQGG